MANIKIGEKPLLIFDGETTGANPSVDEFIQLAALKIHPDGTSEQKEWWFNPKMLISEGAIAVHGFTEDFVKNFDSFSKQAREVLAFFNDCVLCGYNSDYFDLEILIRQLEENHLFLNEIDTLDVFELAGIVYSRKLGNMFKLLTGSDPIDAHNAISDVKMTKDVLFSMVYRHGLPNSIKELQAIIKESKGNSVDRAGKLVLNESGVVCFNFGKNIGKPVKENLSYATWMLSQDSFSRDTKEHIKKVLS